MPMNKKILITGIYGFLGQHLAQRLHTDNEIIGINQSNQDKNFQLPNYEFVDEKIIIEDINYYHSNSIARASKTMTDCINAKIKLKKTGIEI